MLLILYSFKCFTYYKLTLIYIYDNIIKKYVRLDITKTINFVVSDIKTAKFIVFFSVKNY